MSTLNLPPDDQPCGEYFELPMTETENIAQRVASIECHVARQALNAKLQEAITYAKAWQRIFDTQHDAYINTLMQDPNNREAVNALTHKSEALTRAQQIAGVLLSDYIWTLRVEVANLLEQEAPNEHWLDVADMIRDMSLHPTRAKRGIEA